MIIFNSVLLRLSGSLAVAAFSVVMYIDSVVISALYGITDSMQPAISYCYGAGLKHRMMAVEKRVLAAVRCYMSAHFYRNEDRGRISYVPVHKRRRRYASCHEYESYGTILFHIFYMLDRTEHERVFYCGKQTGNFSHNLNGGALCFTRR